MKCSYLLPLPIIAAALGCGSSSGAPPDGGVDAAAAGSFEPLAVGNQWIYQVTATDGTISNEVVSIPDQEPVGGTGPYSAMLAFRVVTGEKVADSNGDLAWEGEADGRVVRYREVSVGENKGNEKNESYWDPPRLRVDETAAHIVDGATWTEPAYTEYDIDVDTDPDGGTFIPTGGMTTQPDQLDVWTVVAASQQIVVPAGTFSTLVLRRVNASGNAKNYWFARGVGLVRQSEENKATHELASYQLAAP